MSDDQAQVLVGILVLLLMEVAIHPAVKAYFVSGYATVGNSVSGKGASPASSTSTPGLTLKQTFYYGIGALALLALAGPQPGLAKGFLLLVIMAVVLTHADTFTGYLKAPVSTAGKDFHK